MHTVFLTQFFSTNVHFFVLAFLIKESVCVCVRERERGREKETDRRGGAMKLASIEFCLAIILGM